MGVPSRTMLIARTSCYSDIAVVVPQLHCYAPSCGLPSDVTLKPTECPTDLEKVAAAYIMGTLREEQAISFENHYAVCDTCATALYETVNYVDAMRRRRGRRAAGSY
jgi:hypothetical protein